MATALVLVLLSLVVLAASWTIRSLLFVRSATVSQYETAQARACAEGALRIAKSICAFHAPELLDVITNDSRDFSLELSPRLEQELTRQLRGGRIMLSLAPLSKSLKGLTLTITLYGEEGPLYALSTDYELG